MSTPVAMPRPASEERFYQEAVTRLRAALQHGQPPEAVFAAMQAENVMFTRALMDAPLNQAMLTVFTAKSQQLNPQMALPLEVKQRLLGDILVDRMQAQAQQMELLGQEAFRREVVQRAATPGPDTPHAPILEDDARALAKRYVQALPALGQVGVATAVMGERMTQQALALTFNGGNDQPLLKPLMEAMARAQVPVGRNPAQLAESFLGSRTQEALEKIKLLAPEGPVMQQVASAERHRIYEGRLAEPPAVRRGAR